MDSPALERLLSSFLAVAGLLIIATPAQATFPGANGKIAFERGNETAENDIYVVNPDGTGESNLTHNGSNNRQIAWSPDGSQIAFFSDGDGSDNYYDIHVASVDGSGPRRLANTGGASQPAWSPDGRSIAFADGFIYTVRPDGSDLRNITGTQLAAYPAWSPDGRKISFLSATDSRWDFYVVNVNGSGLARLTDDTDHIGSTASWSPDGRTIAYTSSRDSGCRLPPCPGLWIMNADGTNERRLAGGDGQVVYPTWAPDGSKIAFDRFGEVPGPQIYTINRDGSDETRVTNNPVGSYAPEWSPDSTQLTFSRWDPATESHWVYVIHQDGSGERRVAQGDGSEWQPLPRKREAELLCKNERRSLGQKAFRQRYGRERKGSGAFRHCTDQHTAG